MFHGFFFQFPSEFQVIIIIIIIIIIVIIYS